MPGHRGDETVGLSLRPACRQCVHLNLALKSSEASSFRCSFSIFQSSLNFSLEHKATTLCSSRAQKQYFHHKPTLFQIVQECSAYLFFPLSSCGPRNDFPTPHWLLIRKRERAKGKRHELHFKSVCLGFSNPKVQEIFYFKHDVIATCYYAQYRLILEVWKVLKGKCS